MSKSVASASQDYNKSYKTGRKRGEDDEENEDGEEFIEVPPAEGLTISTVDSNVPATTDQFMHTPDFRRHFVEFVPGDTLMTLRFATKGWNAAADAFIDEGVQSSAMMVHSAKDISLNVAEAL